MIGPSKGFGPRAQQIFALVFSVVIAAIAIVAIIFCDPSATSYPHNTVVGWVIFGLWISGFLAICFWGLIGFPGLEDQKQHRHRI